MTELDLEPPAADDDPPPPLLVSGPDGRRLTIEPSRSTHTVGELADAVGVPRRAAVLVDGRPIDRRVRLDRAGVVAGVRVAGANTRVSCRADRDVQAEGDAVAEGVCIVTIDAGPAAGEVFALPPGRHLIGRSASCTIRLDDPLAELHHAALDVASAETTIVQLAGRVPCWSELAEGPRQPAARAATTPGHAVLSIGASRLRLVAGTTPETAAAPATLRTRRDDPWRVSLQRPPRQPVDFVAVPIDPPMTQPSHPRRGAGGLLAGILSVIGGVALAIVLGHPMYLIFSGIGFVTVVGSALGTRLGDRKHRRRQGAESARDEERFAGAVAAQQVAASAFQRATAPRIDGALAAVRCPSRGLWARRGSHADGFAVTLGWGTMPWEARIAGPADELSSTALAIVERHGELDDVPVTTTLGSGQSMAIVGEHGAAIARSLIVQLAACTGPADWRLVVVADDPAVWEWAAWLPHASTGSTSPTIVAADDGGHLAGVLSRLDDGDGRHVVIVTDRPDALANRTGALRRYLAAAPSTAVVAVVRPDSTVPPLCRGELRIGSRCIGRWCPDLATVTSAPSRVHAAGISIAVAADAARRLARIHDPEDPDEAAGACPTSVALSRVLSRRGLAAVDDSIAIAAAWRAGARGDGDASHLGHPRAVLGMTADGVVEIDLVCDGPHALIAGTTGAGKSELLRTLVAAMAASNGPDDLTFVLIDYKGGSTFDACADLPHTVGVVTDLDDRLAERALVSLEAELRRRERLLRTAGSDDLDAYRAAARNRPLPRLVVVIDEFAALAADLPGFLPSLVGIAQRGRSLGIHLVLATQRPAGVVNDEIRANTNLRIALRLQDRADAVDIVGVVDPASFPRGVPGRAMLRLGAGETVVFQTAHSSGESRPLHGDGLRVSADGVPRRPVSGDGRCASDRPRDTELTALARAIRGAASLMEVHPPFRPWLDPLPTILPVMSLDDHEVGLIDDPAAQRQVPLRWERSAGNLALIGSLGSGTTTAVRSLLVAAGSTAQCYVIDARGDGSLDSVGGLPGCGAVVGPHESERRVRLVRYLADELVRRQADPESPRPSVILAIDGLGTLLASLSGPGDLEDHARLLRVLTDGAAAGIHSVATIERPGAVPHAALAALTQRWLFHLDDPVEAATLGIRAVAVPAAIPGRLVLVDSRCHAQLAMLAVPAAPDGWDGGVRPMSIGTLGDDIDAATLPASSHHDGATSLILAIDFATLTPARLELPDGEHVLVAGPARSGRSTALISLVAGWHSAHGDGLVVVCCPRRTSPVGAWVRTAVAGHVVAEDEAAIVDAVGTAHRRVLVVVDDAERVVDADGMLAALVAERDPDVTVVAAGRPDSLRTMYGHWTSVVRRSHIGFVMSSASEIDGDLFGEVLPRRLPIAVRPGLAWMIDAGGRHLVQLARQPTVAGSVEDPPRPTASRQETRLPALRIERE